MQNAGIGHKSNSPIATAAESQPKFNSIKPGELSLFLPGSSLLTHYAE